MDKIEVSVKDEIKNVTAAMQRVTQAVFAGGKGSSASIKGKRKSAQFTFKLKNSSDKSDIQKIAREKIIHTAFVEKGVEMERQIKQALENVVAGLIGYGNNNVRVFGKSLGSARPQRPLEQEGFAKFIKSKEGAGEIGLPDPQESLNNLKIALISSIVVDVIVTHNGPQVKFNFDQRRLLRLTPHPSRFESGAPAPFYSWLSLVTGPDFASSGTPGFGLVRVKDITNKLKSQNEAISRMRSKRGMRSVRALENLTKLSRTRDNAGEFAGLMLSIRKKGGNKSPAEFAGGNNQQYRPSRQFEGFWDMYWMQLKSQLSVWTHRIMFSAVRSAIQGG